MKRKKDMRMISMIHIKQVIEQDFEDNAKKIKIMMNWHIK